MAIPLLLRYFNILSVTVMAFFAIYGIIAIAARNSSLTLNIFRSRPFIQSFCIAALAAFALEATVCNFPHYLKYFADGEFHTLQASPADSTIILTSDGTLAEKFTEKADTTARDTLDKAATATSSTLEEYNVTTYTSLQEKEGATDDALGGVIFKNLNRRVTSLFIEPVFDTAATVTAVVTVTTEWGKLRTIRAIFKGLPHTNYIQFQPLGDVSELKVGLYGTKSTGASVIAVNRQIPLYFSGLRLLVTSLLFFAIILFAHRPLRAQVAHFLFDYKFDPSNRRQNIVYILSVVALVAFSWVCAYTSVTEDRPQARQYNKYLVDALMEGRVNLEAGNPEKMQNAPNPYYLQWLDENGYERFVEWMPDWAYYKGKFYCYFGVVPALALYVPVKAVTGKYLSNHGGIFLFAAISIALLARLWRLFVKRFMPNARFAFYLLSFFALFFASGLYCPLRFTRFYSIVSAAGFMFVIAGILLLFEAIERENGKIDRSKLFFSAMCLALAVGCRPHLLFASLIVPVILWKHKLWKWLPLMAVPYIVVAVPMCMYNYARFGSILDFGFKYNLTNLNTAGYGLLNPIGRVINTFIASLSYMFMLNKYSLFYPYVECIQQHNNFYYAIVKFYDRGVGMINFPIILCLFYYIKVAFTKNRPQTFYIMSVFLTIAAALILINSYMVGFSGRYVIDFAVFMILPALFCANYWCADSGAAAYEYQSRIRQKTVYSLLIFSIFVGLSLFATSVTNDDTPGNPVLYRYLRLSLCLFGVV